MKKINGFTITRLSMSGFKCFEDTAAFDFGDMTSITASNGKGKSSIADAIAFAFVGTPFFGDKGLDRLQNRNTPEMTVSLDFVDDNGESHELTRTRKHDATTITYDGFVIRQTDLNTAFGDKDIFLSILNPLYFINVLGDKGKGLLEKLLPVVSHEEVLAAMSSDSQEILADQSLLSPETFIKDRRSELREFEETLIGYRSQKELLDYQREERAVSINELREAVDRITDEMAELAEVRDNNRDPAEEESSLEELRKRRDELLSDITQNGNGKAVQGIMDEIKAVEKTIATLNATQYISAYTAQTAEAETELKVMRDEHSRISKALTETVVGYKCPTCAVVITAENIDTVKADLQRRLSDLVNDGKTIRESLAKINSQDNTDKQEFDKEKAVILEREHGKLTELNQQLQEMNVAGELDSEEYGERLMVLESQISEQERRMADGNLTPEQIQLFTELDRTKKENEARIETLNGISDYDFAPLIEETERETARLKLLISEAIQYMAKRVELMLDGLKMSNTEIVLTEIIKTTGELKDCFRFSYDGRDYKCLSLSEKVRAGLDVSLLIQKLSGREYPIFVDNCESVCSFGDVQPGGQVITSRVIRNQELQVAYRNREQSEIAA